MACKSINVEVLKVNALRQSLDKLRSCFRAAGEKFAALGLDESHYQPWEVERDTPREANFEGGGVLAWIEDTRLPRAVDGKFVGEEEVRAEYLAVFGKFYVTLKRRFS